jgi:hypothetical protein
MKNNTKTTKTAISQKIKKMVQRDVLVAALIASVALNLFAVTGYVLIEGTNDYGVVVYQK